MTTKLQPGSPSTTRGGGEPRVGRPDKPAPRSAGQGILNVFSHAFLVLWALMVVVPLAWAVLTSFKTDAQIFSSPWSLPDTLHFENWSRAWNEANIGGYFVNTLIVVSGSMIGTMLLGAMAAYVLARFEFPGNKAIYYLFVAGMSFPVFLALVPLFFVLKNLAMLNTYQGLILTYIGYSLPFTVFFLTAFFRTLPTSIAEAAFIDGASHSRIFFHVMLPMAKPGLISIGIFNFLGQWNQYLLPVVLNQDPDKYVLTQGLASLAISQGYKGDWSGLFAGLVIAMIPVLIVYAVFQGQIQKGLTAGALR